MYDAIILLHPGRYFNEIEWSLCFFFASIKKSSITFRLEKFKQEPFSANEVVGKFIEGPETGSDTLINQIFGQVMNKSAGNFRSDFADTYRDLDSSPLVGDLMDLCFNTAIVLVYHYFIIFSSTFSSV